MWGGMALPFSLASLFPGRLSFGLACTHWVATGGSLQFRDGCAWSLWRSGPPTIEIEQRRQARLSFAVAGLSVQV